MQYYYYDGTKEVRDTRMHDIYSVLKDNDIDVYFQAQHKGDCLNPYVVVLSRGETRLSDMSSTVTRIEVLCYVPLKEPSRIESYCNEVKEAMKKLRPMVKPLYSDLGDYIDDGIKAVMRTMQYQYYCKIDD